MMYLNVTGDGAKHDRRIVLTVGFCKDQQLHNLPANKENIQTFLSVYNGKSYNFIVSKSNHLYATPDMPAYWDGDRIATVNGIIDALPTIKETATVTAENMRPMIETNQIKFFGDAGHGWLRVPLSLIGYLGINELITGYSYTDKKFAYLEEDFDLTTFFIAIGLPCVDETKPMLKLFWQFCPQDDCDRSPIRNYPSYDNVKMAKLFSSSSLLPATGLAVMSPQG